MSISLSYPDQSYSQANKPSNETLKSDLVLIEDAINAAEGSIVGTTATQTLTNKTLTSPTINNGTLTSSTLTSTTINSPIITSPTIKLWDGWNTVSDTWTYASASTITVPSGATAIYQKGDKIKITQTTEKYFYILSVADTVLTITGGTDYTLTNATITAPFYSHVENPVGFPNGFTIATNQKIKMAGQTMEVTGWTFVRGDGISNEKYNTITFGVAFASAPLLMVSCLGFLTTGDPTVISDFNTGGGGGGSHFAYSAQISATGFLALTAKGDSTVIEANRRVGIAWRAISLI